MARERCKVCCNAVSACICKWISPIDNKTTIVILQHSDEVKKPLGTAKIVTLSLQNAVLKIGVDFSDDVDFNQLVYGTSEGVGILYPSESAITFEDWVAKERCPQGVNNADQLPKTLIVLDGTWRNTREIINVNPVLKNLQGIQLTPAQQSNYRIRKAPFKNSLSTVEAVAQALNALEPETSVGTMLNCFQNMIDYQIRCMGEEVYRKNYLSD
ncbi:tRNA-uridine aminocarboxypropyltransferase [Alkalimarinus alittae]|uniref:tRNA-uridine aminocarboxypropyltransferase n=1 Tax=Alkalimarinus alittae TaxID=2961619 RepID=A0ABY6N6N1_9ALTE|nr:tRNA-uridine aminocarboxypropyltransferase [Alkalimarinus alittae]UZE97674.1 DTW domain-containing protein [Alkalimarinus alittae]